MVACYVQIASCFSGSSSYLTENAASRLQSCKVSVTGVLILSPTRKETSSEACQGRARFQQHRDASCHRILFLQGKAPKEIHAILTETLACFLPGRAKDLSASMYFCLILTYIGNYRQNLTEDRCMKFDENPSGKSRAVECGRSDVQRYSFFGWMLQKGD